MQCYDYFLFSLYLLVVTVAEWQEGGNMKHNLPGKGN